MTQPFGMPGILLNYAPDRNCPKCLAEQIDALHHMIAVVGSPCWTDDPNSRILREHLCRRCLHCGYGWCEETADAYAAGEQTPGEPP
jgi:hypothetical protein